MMTGEPTRTPAATGRPVPGGEQRRCAGCSAALARDNTAAMCASCHREMRDHLDRPPKGLPDDFWTTDDFRAAFESQHMGRVLKAYRFHFRYLRTFGKALNQDLLGRWLGLTQAQVSKLENGKPEENLSALRSYATILCIPQRLLWFDLPGQTRVAIDDRASSEPANWPLNGSARQLLPDVLIASAFTEIGTTTAFDIAAIRSLAVAVQTTDRQIGGGALYGQVARYLRYEIAPRLLDTGGENGSALCAAACSMTEIAGWMAHDGGSNDRARHHFDSAYRLAVAADHAPLIANVCASMAHLATQLRQPTEAIRIAGAGLERASRGQGTTRLVARLHALRAGAWAITGDSRQVIGELAKAESALSRAESESPAEWISGFDAASLAGEAASALRLLGDLKGAQAQAELVVELRVGDRVRSRVFGQIKLATVLAERGRLDEAAAVGSEVCGLIPSLSSVRTHKQLEELGDLLRPNGSDRHVAEFIQQLDSLDLNGSRSSHEWPV